MSDNNTIIYDNIKGIKSIGEFSGSIVSKCKDEFNSIIFSDNIKITWDDEITINNGLVIGFELVDDKKSAFSKKANINSVNINEFPLEYAVLIPDDIMEQYDEGQFSDAFPFTLNLLHTAGLYLNEKDYEIDHLDFFKGEILKNPVALIFNGMCVADRAVIDHRGDPVFYDCLIIGRDQNENLSVSYDPVLYVDDTVIQYIVILGIEELKF